MKLSEYERLTLAAHYRILDKLDPNQGWSAFVKILEEGFEAEYSSLTDLLYDPLPTEECRFVLRTLATFDALQRPYVDRGEEVPGELEFPGFDGNNESQLLGYFRFLLDQGRFTYLKLMLPDGNSHAPLADGYRKMVAAWQELGEPHVLTGEASAKVLAARNA